MKFYLIPIISFLIFSYSNAQIKVAVNRFKNNLNHITPKQSKLIYENTKTFPNNTELSIAIIKNGDINFIGIRRTNDKLKFRNNKHNVFEVGSISKIFTSTLLTNLMFENRLKLNDSIQQHLNFDLKTGQNITFQELSNHTSGLPRLPSNLNLKTAPKANPYKEYDEQKLRIYLTNKIELNQEHGNKYEYSNLGVGLLGFIMTKISKSTYEDLLQEKILSKYGMTNSTTIRSKIKSKLIYGLNSKGKKTSNWDMNVLTGAGAILSSTTDLSKFALAQFNIENQELTLTQKSTFKVNDDMSIGLGWHIFKTKNGNQIISHEGATGGYTSLIALDIKNKNGVIILSNVSGWNQDMGNIENLGFGIIETLSTTE